MASQVQLLRGCVSAELPMMVFLLLFHLQIWTCWVDSAQGQMREEDA